MDRYTKVVLTLIAFALWTQLLVNLAHPGGGFISEAQAQQLVSLQAQVSLNGPALRVVVAGYDNDGFPKAGPVPVAFATGGQPAPVYFAPSSAQQAAVPVNIYAVGNSPVQSGATLPVTVADVTAAGGVNLRTSGGIPVVSGTHAMNITAASDGLPVAVKSMPRSAAFTQSPAQSTATSTTSQMPPTTGPGN
jgi:hypothetical protein